jgi:hypothetical protein
MLRSVSTSLPGWRSVESVTPVSTLARKPFAVLIVQQRLGESRLCLVTLLLQFGNAALHLGHGAEPRHNVAVAAIWIRPFRLVRDLVRSEIARTSSAPSYKARSTLTRTRRYDEPLRKREIALVNRVTTPEGSSGTHHDCQAL